MALWAELLEQAEILADGGTGSPTQAGLRRSVSTAYYALFHFLAGEAAERLLPFHAPGLSAAMQRGFEHRVMKEACRDFANGAATPVLKPLIVAPVEPELLDMARVFLNLQAARQSADYDLLHSIAQIEAKDFARSVHDVVEGWGRVAGSPNTSVFVARLAGLIGRRKSE